MHGDPRQPRSGVAYVAAVYPKLSETFVTAEVASLRSAGESVTVLAESAEPGADPALAATAVVYAPRLPRLRDLAVGAAMAVRSLRWATSVPEAGRAWWLAWRLYAAASRLRPAQLHAHFATAPTLAALLLGRALDVPVTATFHANDYLVGVSPRALTRRVALLDAVFAISASARDEILRRTQSPPAKVHVVRAGIVESLVAREPHAGRREPTVVVVARLVPKKGIDRLLRGFALMSRGGGMRLVVVGDGPERARLDRVADELGIADRVDFLGAMPHARALDHVWRSSVAALTAVVDGGDADGIPVFLMEAAAAGLPIVTTAVGGVPELVRDGETGIVLADVEPATVAAGLDAALDDSAGRLGAAARKTVLGEFDPGLQTTRLRAVWDAIAAARSGVTT